MLFEPEETERSQTNSFRCRGEAMRIAVASMEGAYINHGLHAAEQFFVFDVSLSGISFVEKRENRCREQVSSPKTLQGIGEMLRDCKIVCCTQAGADAVEF